MSCPSSSQDWAEIRRIIRTRSNNTKEFQDNNALDQPAIALFTNEVYRSSIKSKSKQAHTHSITKPELVTPKMAQPMKKGAVATHLEAEDLLDVVDLEGFLEVLDGTVGGLGESLVDLGQRNAVGELSDGIGDGLDNCGAEAIVKEVNEVLHQGLAKLLLELWI